MTDNILQQLWFQCYAIAASPDAVLRAFHDRYGDWPATALCTTERYKAITAEEQDEVACLPWPGGKARVTAHPNALGMWFVGPIPTEVTDGNQ